MHKSHFNECIKSNFHLVENKNHYFCLNALTLDYYKINQLTYDILYRIQNETLSKQTLLTVFQDKSVPHILKEIENLFESPNLPTLDHGDDTIRDLWINVSQVCNMNCVYCYADGGTYGNPKTHIELNLAYQAIEKQVQVLNRGDSLTIRFFGGEPLMNFNGIQKIVNFCNNLYLSFGVHFHFQLNTNATLINEEMLSFFKKNGFFIYISIDGSADIQSKMRPLTGLIKDPALTEIKAKLILKSLDPLNVQADCVISKENYNIDETHHYLKALGFKIVKFIYLSNKKLGLTKIETTSVIEKFNITIQKSKDPFSIGIIKNIYQRIQNKEKRTFFCKTMKNGYSMDVDGNYYVCHRFIGLDQFKVGSVKDGVHSEKRKFFLNSQLENKKECQTCWARFVCGGGCYYQDFVKNGRLDTPDQDYCHYFRSLTESVLKNYELLSKQTLEEK